MNYDVELDAGVCRIRIGSRRVEATDAEHDRRGIRASVALLDAESLLHRDRVNLSSAISRGRFLRAVNGVAETLSDAVLLALEEALRQQSRRRSRSSGAAPVADADPTRTRPNDLEDLEIRIRRRLLIEDADAVPVTLGVLAAHLLPGDPPWAMIVGPPAGAKSELVMMARHTPGAYFLSELTSKTFASGLTTGGPDPSLLARLTTEVLLFKDFTTVLQMNRDERQTILAQLREIYDGRYDKAWGSGKELHWQGRLGFLAGVTPVIDSHHGVMAVLGQRFVFLRLRQPTRQLATHRAIRNTREARAWQAEIAHAVADYLTSLPTDDPLVDESTEQGLVQLSDLVTRARSAVEREGWRRELEYAPEPEMPMRFARQLDTLLRGLARLEARAAVSGCDLGRVVRVGMDSIPAVRRLLLSALAKGDEDLTTTALAQQLQYSTTTLRRACEDLQSLGLVTCAKAGTGRPDRWSLREEWRDPVSRFSAMAADLRARYVSPRDEPFATPGAAAPDDDTEWTDAPEGGSNDGATGGPAPAFDPGLFYMPSQVVRTLGALPMDEVFLLKALLADAEAAGIVPDEAAARRAIEAAWQTGKIDKGQDGCYRADRTR